MRDLDKRIEQWRTGLAGSEVLASSDIDELENHLREEIENLTGLTLSDEEAFLIATHRLGSTDSLAEEYEKINRGVKFRQRLFWMIAGILGYLLVTRFAGAVSEGCVLLAGISGLRGYSLGFVGIMSKILTVGMTILLFYQAYKQDGNRPGLSGLVSESKGKVILFTAVAAFVSVLAVAQLFLPAMTVRMMSLREYGQMALVSASVQLVLPVLLPLILVIMLIRLHGAKLHETRISQINRDKGTGLIV